MERLREFLRMLIPGFMLTAFGCNTGPGNHRDASGLKAIFSDSPVAIMIFVPECPWAMRYASEFQKLQLDEQFGSVSFVALIPGNLYHHQDIVQFRKESGYEGRIILDPMGKVADDLNATISPQFFILNREKKVLYDGAFDNRLKDLGQHRLKADTFYFRNALTAMLHQKEIFPSKTKATGCYLENDL